MATDAENVKWGHVSLLKAELKCMKKLVSLSHKWNYLINLGGEELPLMTNLELVTVLSKLNGSNVLDGECLIANLNYIVCF